MLETKQNSRTRIERVGISHDVSNPRGAVVNVCVGGTHVEVLLDTGATTNLIRTDVALRMVEAPMMERYVGRLETADGQIMAFDGVVRTRSKLGDICRRNRSAESRDVPRTTIDERVSVLFGVQSRRRFFVDVDERRFNGTHTALDS